MSKDKKDEFARDARVWRLCVSYDVPGIIRGRIVSLASTGTYTAYYVQEDGCFNAPSFLVVGDSCRYLYHSKRTAEAGARFVSLGIKARTLFRGIPRRNWYYALFAAVRRLRRKKGTARATP